MDTPLSSTQPTRSKDTWKKLGEKTLTRPRVTRSAGKIIMIIFWDCRGVLLGDFLPHGITINSSCYATTPSPVVFSYSGEMSQET